MLSVVIRRLSTFMTPDYRGQYTNFTADVYRDDGPEFVLCA